MRYSTRDSKSTELWQRVLFVLLGAGCVVFCYFAGAYVVGPWIHRMKNKEPVAATSPPEAIAQSTTTASRPALPTLSPVAPKLVGVRVRETDPNLLPDTVRVIPPGGAAPPDETVATEEPHSAATLEEQPSATPSTQLWSQPASPPAPTRRTNEPATPPAPSGLQVPQQLDGEPASGGNAPSDVSAPTDVLYRVRLRDTFASREDADAALRSVTEKGLPGAVVGDTTGGRPTFRVQLGTYRNKSSAEKLAEQARRTGIPAEVTASSP